MYNRVKDLADLRGLSISEIERRADLGNGTIRRWDKSYPSVDKVAKVAGILNTTIEYLYNGVQSDISTSFARKIDVLDESEQKAVNDLIDFYLSKK